jgi:hypothetical protein
MTLLGSFFIVVYIIVSQFTPSSRIVEVMGKWKYIVYFLLEQVQIIHRFLLVLYLGPTCASVDAHRQIEEAIKREATPKEGAKLHFKSHYPRSYWHQFLLCLWRVSSPSAAPSQRTLQVTHEHVLGPKYGVVRM